MVRRGACHESPTTALQKTAVLQSISLYHKVPLRSTKYYCAPQSSTKYYILCTTKYYKVLPRTTQYKILLCTTKYSCVLQSSTKYYSVLQSITPQKALQSTYKVQQSSTPRHMKRPIHCGGYLWYAKHNGTTTFMRDCRNT